MNRYLSLELRVGTLVLCSVLSSACSGTSDAPGETPSAPAAEESVSSQTAEVAVVASPNATCKLFQGNERDPAKALDVYADDEGIVRFYSHRAASNDPLAIVSLHCGEAGQLALVRTIDRRDPSVFQALPETKSAAVVRKIRAALSAEQAQSASADDLLRQGHTPRPDAQRQPERYARWVESVSRPAQVIEPHLVERPDLHGGPQSFENSSNWGGTVLKNAGPYYLTNVVFTIPTVSTANNGRFVIWGGLGGYGGQVNSALIQNGIFVVVSGGVATYNVFYEYWRNAGITITNFTIRPGDVLEATAWPTDNDENWNAVGIRGCFSFNNRTRGTVIEKVCMRTNSQNPPFTGATAEFITETQTSFLPNFGSVVVTGGAWAAGGRVADTSTDPFATLTLTNSSGGTRVQVTNLSASDARHRWISGT